MKFGKKIYHSGGVSLASWVFFGLVLVGLTGPTPVNAAAPSADWHDTGVTLPAATDTNGSCIDDTRPNTFYINEGDSYHPKGTLAYNWQTGQKTSLNQRQFSFCANGFLYATQKFKPALRFSLDNPAGIVLAHTPVAVARDSSLLAYALDRSQWDDNDQPYVPAAQDQNHLWVSPDGGLTWQERATNLTGVFYSLIISPGDARSVYLLTRSLEPDQKDPTGQIGDYTVTIYYSGDAGVTWDKRTDFPFPNYGTPPYLQNFSSINTPANTLMKVSEPYGTHGGYDYDVSLDGGRTFKTFDQRCDHGCEGYQPQVWMDFGAQNFLKLDYLAPNKDDPAHPNRTQLAALQANGDWLPIPTPEELGSLYDPTPQVVGNSPNNLLITAQQFNEETKTLDPDKMGWYSPDSGTTWQKLPGMMENILPTPYSPLTLLGIKGGKLFTFNLVEQEKLKTQTVPAVGSPNVSYSAPTGHNLSGQFKVYYDAHGGLAQFGYPWTEPFREVNPSDGKIYLVQYFERNRFEYHPELNGTPYDVLLGLLGNQLTQSRREAGEGAFNHFDDMHYPGGTYFSEVGHNLRNSFKAYWEANGGLAIYGYPISEEFEEKNPDDGRTYVVQYFERARFEYHPENKGTSYEVLLGLLGNTLLESKGFL